MRLVYGFPIFGTIRPDDEANTLGKLSSRQ